MKRTTIRDIAERVGVTKKTVSKALNDLPGVGDELRMTIKSHARELNYRPNMYGRGLSGKLPKTLGVVISDNSSPAYALLLNGIEKAANRNGYAVIMSNTGENPEAEDAQLEALACRQVQGVIISPVGCRACNPGLDALDALRVPYVLVNRDSGRRRDNCIRQDHLAGAVLAVEHLLDRGHRAILHLTCQAATSVVKDRINGLRSALRKRGLDASAATVRATCRIDIESGYREMLAALDGGFRGTAVFAFNDVIAFGVLKALREKGISVPRDMAVIGYDNIPFAQISDPPLTTVHQALQEVGEAAVNALLAKLTPPHSEPVACIPSPYIVERKST